MKRCVSAFTTVAATLVSETLTTNRHTRMAETLLCTEAYQVSMASANRRSLSAFVCAVTAASFCLPLSAAAATVQRVGTASIENDEAAGTWTIGSDGATLVLGLDVRRDFEIVRATSPSDRVWITSG